MNLFKCLVLAFMVNYAQSAQRTDMAESADSSGWMKSAQDTLAGPAGHMIVQVAKELINRSLGNSQVLSLNLSNLLILILLKALIFAAGLIGAGHWSHYARGRSEAGNATSLLDEGEPMLFVGFLASQGSGDSSCLYKAACHAPATAYEYARAAKALLNSIDKFGGSTDNKSQYENLIDTLQRAAYDGYKGSPCDLMYRCNL